MMRKERIKVIRRIKKSREDVLELDIEGNMDEE